MEGVEDKEEKSIVTHDDRPLGTSLIPQWVAKSKWSPSPGAESTLRSRRHQAKSGIGRLTSRMAVGSWLRSATGRIGIARECRKYAHPFRHDKSRSHDSEAGVAMSVILNEVRTGAGGDSRRRFPTLGSHIIGAPKLGGGEQFAAHTISDEPLAVRAIQDHSTSRPEAHDLGRCEQRPGSTIVPWSHVLQHTVDPQLQIAPRKGHRCRPNLHVLQRTLGQDLDQTMQSGRGIPR